MLTSKGGAGAVLVALTATLSSHKPPPSQAGQPEPAEHELAGAPALMN
ncbi:hypothetical protein LJ656_29110 [Paraburkholderia sp. MMS20-SJTR3]|uniref:Uncharacterized protein n=1 Tax=Paraburkholderia sejongensis TaxID=2886946 RepID=A0ABS8K3C5_9BURK|nr:hypothetical protein [Paraburkholderia sp. MMS20-SJTR3]